MSDDKLNPNYQKFLDSFSKMMPLIVEHIVAALFEREHTSGDISDIVLTDFAQTGGILSDEWDYFIQNTAMEAQELALKLLKNKEIDNPLLVIIENIGQDFKHKSLWMGTAGMPKYEYYCNSIDEKHRAYATENIKESIDRFFQTGISNNGSQKLGVIGDSKDIEIMVNSKQIEPVFGYALYAFPIKFPTEIHPLAQTEIVNEMAGLKFNFNLTRNYLQNPAVTKKSITESTREIIGTYKLQETVKADSIEYKFENSVLVVPDKFEYEIYVTLNENKIVFDNLSALSEFLYKLSEGKIRYEI